MLLRSALLGAVAICMATPVLAQFPATAPAGATVMTRDAPPDWAGVHASVFLPVYVTDGPVPGIGVAAGYDLTRGRLLAGVETYATYLSFASPDIDFVVRARLGVLIDPSFLVFGAAGVGYYLGGASGDGGLYGHAAIGTELALTHHVTLRTQAVAYRYPGGIWEYGVTGGFAWYFDR